MFFPNSGGAVVAGAPTGLQYDEPTLAGFEDQTGLVPAGGQQTNIGTGLSAGQLVQDPEGLEDSAGPLTAGGTPDYMTGVPAERSCRVPRKG